MYKHKPPDEPTTRRMIELYQQGASLLQVGESIGRSWFYARTVLLKNGCKMRPSGHHVLRPDLDTNEMLAMHGEGLSFAEIARRLKCSADVVRKRVRGIR